MNSYVVKQTTWNKRTIEERADELCEMSKIIWEYPNLGESELRKFSKETKIEELINSNAAKILNGENI